MKVSFYLRKERTHKKTGLIPIAILVSNDGKTIRKNLSKVHVLEKHWDPDNQRIIPNSKNEPNNCHLEFNLQMDEIEHRLKENWARSFHLKRKLSENDIQKIIDNGIVDELDNKSADLIKTFKIFIDQNRSSKAERTIKGYVTCFNTIQDFCKHSKSNYQLQKIDLIFFDNFRNYCFDEKKYLNNTFAKMIANIKTFMRWSADRGLHNSDYYTRFKAPEESIEVIFLTLEELTRLEKFEFSNERLSRARDLYLFSSYSGLRYSDFSTLKASNIYENALKLTVKKTKSTDHIIPLNNQAKQILEKYENSFYSPLPLISAQKLNKSIQEACKVVGINTPTNIVRYSGGKRIEKNYPKYELITIHSARKTFVTNSLIIGMNQQAIKNITGHKKDATFQKYLKISDQFNANEMQLWNKLSRNETN